MSDRKATNKYYPPDWDPSKGSINTYRGQHHLRDRARKLDQGILIVRFEMPFNVFCLSCNNHIGVGVRYNAEKKSVGKYFTTTIFSFRMKCHLCSNQLEIETDPQNRDFKIISGLKKRSTESDTNTISASTTDDQEIIDDNSNNNYNESNNSEYDSSLIKFKDEKEAELLENNTFYRLEYKNKDIEKGKRLAPNLQNLYYLMGDRSFNDYNLSSELRKNFRDTKKAEQKEIKENESKGIHIKLVPEHNDDIVESKSINFDKQHLKRKAEQDKLIKRETIQNSSIFNNNSSSSNNNSLPTTTSKISKTKSSTTTTNTKLELLKKKAKIDPSIFKSSSSTINTAFSSSLFK
ncbi:hypothetical protein CYY_000339 [Polysphondylium violaceum]|uniref:Coiled-coil domain-containing protein n=1 Tax=Polysphondylium violaceum TaxID=133409 RepID=A0A8J4Q404_9MYCE|nr:hypothetical protein CYY_000339 [Polysphondylium violaceum]